MVHLHVCCYLVFNLAYEVSYTVKPYELSELKWFEETIRLKPNQTLTS